MFRPLAVIFNPFLSPITHTHTYSSDFIPIISQFGVYGDGMERVTKYTYNKGFNVLCSSHTPNVTIYWQFINGSRIGINNPGFRAGHFQNGM